MARTASHRYVLAVVMGLLFVVGSCGGEVSEDVDWSEAIEATRAIGTFEAELELGSREGQTPQSFVVVSTLDMDNVVGRALIESGGQRQAEVIFMGEMAWFRFEDPSFLALLPQGIRYVEIATDELVSAGVISLDDDVTWAPLYMLLGATSTRLLNNGESKRTYESSIDVSLIDSRLPASVRPAFMATLSDFLQPEAFTTVVARTTLDADDRVIEFALDAELNPATTGASSDTAFIIRLAVENIDAPVAVQEPDPDVVTSVDSIPGLRDSLQGPGPGF